MHARQIFTGIALSATLLMGGATAAQAATPSAVAPSAIPLYWENTGETFNRLAPCNTRGEWYWDNYSNVYSWDCRWSGSSYKLWLQKG